MRESNPRPQAAGFTLIELLVVVLIIGILAAMGIASYARTVESSKADHAFALTKSIGTAARMYYLEKNTNLDGNLSPCDPNGAASANCDNACDLMYCGYLARQDLNTQPYTFALGATACGNAGLLACSARRGVNDPIGTSVSPYSGWGYQMTQNGVTIAVGNAPLSVQ